jgi:TRAP-type uncharacterized transport system fused permease subunit
MFVFHFSTIGAITPPVALAAYAAATISTGNPMKTGFMAFRVGLIAYIVPFMFVYSPALVAQGPLYSVVLHLITACLGVICICAALQGFFLKPFRVWARAVFLLAGLLLVKGGGWSDLLGVGLGFAGFVLGGQDREQWSSSAGLDGRESAIDPMAETAVNRGIP